MPQKKPRKRAKARALTHTQLNVLHALDPDLERPIDRPIADVLQESRLLELLVTKYGKKLQKGTRLDSRSMTSLADRRVLLESAEAAWALEHLALMSRELKKTYAEAELFKGDAIAALRYFVADDEALQCRVDAIQIGTALPDLVSDLQHLAPLLAGLGSALKKSSLPKNASARCLELHQALAPVAAQMSEGAPAEPLRLLRNRAFWHLRTAMDAVRAAGRYVFRGVPAILVHFRATSVRAKVANRYAYAFDSPTLTNGDGRAQPN